MTILHTGYLLFIFHNAMCTLCRYEGESKEEVNKTNNLSKLLKRIEERKRQRSTVSIKENGVESNLEEPKKKRKKSKNLSDTLETNESHVENKSRSDEKISEQSPETVKASKKKKRKKKNNGNEDQSTIECVLTKNEELELREDSENEKDDENAQKEMPPQSNFIILGAKSRKKQHAVKRVLPDWLVHPKVISADLSIGPSLELSAILDPKLIEILKANGIVKLFPVQSSLIHWLNRCNMDRKMGWWLRDTCVSAPTGSGKHLQLIYSN